jgi:hypothetical protein
MEIISKMMMTAINFVAQFMDYVVLFCLLCLAAICIFTPLRQRKNSLQI